LSPSRPPRWARRIVEALIPGAWREYVLGDLEEMFGRRLERGSRPLAVAAYLLWGLRSAPREWRRSAWPGIGGDLRAAVRQLRTDPGFFLGSIGVLALGLGAGTFVWGIRYGAYDHGLPVSEPDRVVSVQRVERGAPLIEPAFSWRDLEVVRSSSAPLEAVGLFGWGRVALTGPAAPATELQALHVSPSVFRLLEIRPLHGRALTAADAAPGAPRVVVVDHDLWRSRYDSDPDLVGRTVRIDGEPTVVVGVLPPDGRMGPESLWLPIGAHGDPGSRAYWMFGRTAPGVGPQRLGSSLEPVGSALAPEEDAAADRVTLRAVPFAHAFLPPSNTNVRILLQSGALIFLLAAANVANLFLVRTRTRARELSVRRALGAGRLRILRQLVVEAAVPAALGVLGAAGLASAGLGWYGEAQRAYAGGELVVWEVWRLGVPHLALMAAGALLSTVVVSLVAAAPELRRSRLGPVRGGRGATAPTFRLGQALVAVEIAAGGALLLLASLMVRSGWNLRTVDWGFAQEAVMTGRVVLPDRYGSFDDRLGFWRDLEAELRRGPGIRDVTVATQLPMIRYNGSWPHVQGVEVEGWEFSEPDELPRHYVDAVATSFFRTFGAPVVAGREFDSGDGASSEPVVIVNAHFARAFFGGTSPVGRRLRLWRGDDPGPWRTVVGVAPHLWMDSDENADPEGVYLPLAQAAPPEASVALRGSDRASASADLVRGAVGRLDPDVPVVDMMTMPELIRWRTRLYRKDGPVFIWLGLAALALAVTGVYSVVSHIASLRTSELGIRAALGAPRRGLIGRSIRPTLLPAVVGLALGLPLGLRVTRGFSRMMFEVDPWSPEVAAATFALLALTALGASLLPALRAARPDLVRILDGD
jgi:predicted permease